MYSVINEKEIFDLHHRVIIDVGSEYITITKRFTSPLISQRHHLYRYITRSDTEIDTQKKRD